MKLFFVLFLFSALQLHAEDRFSFADDLFSRDDSFRALTVLKEIEFSQRGKKTGFIAQKKIVRLLLESKEYEHFHKEASLLGENYKPFLTDFSHKEYESEMYFFIRNFSKASSDINSLQVSVEKKMYFRLHAENHENIIEEEKECASSNCEKMRKIEQHMIEARVSKSEKLALFLGIIPGAGQAYGGNIKSGLGSFLINAFFASTAIIAFNNEEPAMGYASSVVGATFYLSSIYAGYETTRRYNVSRYQNAKKDLSRIPIEFKIINYIY